MGLIQTPTELVITEEYGRYVHAFHRRAEHFKAYPFHILCTCKYLVVYLCAWTFNEPFVVNVNAF